MSNNDRLEHARHNERVCNYLSKKPDFTDWVITTAFYSALHFAEHKIFPFNTYTSFDNYYRANSANTNKHKALVDLVEKKLPDIARYYNYLRDLSWTARYQNYKYERKECLIAQNHLKQIKEYCTK